MQHATPSCGRKPPSLRAQGATCTFASCKTAHQFGTLTSAMVDPKNSYIVRAHAGWKAQRHMGQTTPGPTEPVTEGEATCPSWPQRPPPSHEDRNESGALRITAHKDTNPLVTPPRANDARPYATAAHVPRPAHKPTSTFIEPQAPKIPLRAMRRRNTSAEGCTRHVRTHKALCGNPCTWLSPA